MFKIKSLYKKARELNKTIVFPEGNCDRVIKAAKIITKKKIAKVILIGDESALVLQDKNLSKFTVINPKTSELTYKLKKILLSKRKGKITEEEASNLVLDPYYFATLLVEAGYADGMVGGLETSTANAIRPSLQIIKAEKKNGLVSSSFFFYGKNKFLGDKVLFLSDGGLNINPTSKDLVEIAKATVKTAEEIVKLEPKIAFLSFSTKGSAKGDEVDKVSNAAKEFNLKGTLSDGELQLDAALVPQVCQKKCPESRIKGDANILIVPNLDCGNALYKAIQYFGGVNAIGPILQGLKKPVNDLSRGASIEDIITMTAITVLQCKKGEL